MSTRIAIIGIIVYDVDSADKINQLLHEYSRCVVARMGVPYHDKNVSVMSVIVDADNDTIGSLSGKLGMIKDVDVKTIYSKV